MFRMRWMLAIVLAMLCWAYSALAVEKKTPVILDTDIGDDIDDTWALGLLLKSPELDLKLVVGDNGNVTYRAKLLAKFLTAAGRTDVPVGIGIGKDGKPAGQAKWVEDYDLKSYPGKVHADGVQAIIDTVMNSPEPITIIAIGPVQNLAEALKREPRIAQKAEFVGMHGSVRLGYDGNKTPAPEYNVKVDAKACQAVFTAAWDMTITPLDTCGLVRLGGQKYQALMTSKDPISQAILANYRYWVGKNTAQFEKGSSVLFDTVAVYLAISQDLCEMEKLPILVTDNGMTVIDEKAGKMMNVATKWKDLGAYQDFLVKRLTEQK